MNGMRIKNHKNQFTQNNKNSTNWQTNDRYTRWTPLGAIRLLPPVPSANITVVARPADPLALGGTKRGKTKATAKKSATTRAKARTPVKKKATKR